jgi:hypothetical protein
MVYLCSAPIGSRSNSRRRLADCTAPTERPPSSSPARDAGRRRRITADNLPSEVPWRPQTSIGGPKGGDGRVCGLRWPGIAGSAQFAPERREGALAWPWRRLVSRHRRPTSASARWMTGGLVMVEWSATAFSHGPWKPAAADGGSQPSARDREERHGMITSTMCLDHDTMPTRLQAVPTKSLAGANITASIFSYIPFLMFACIPNLSSPFHCV